MADTSRSPIADSPVLTRTPDSGDPPVIDYAAHPFLDPDLFRKDRQALRYFRRLFGESLRDETQYAHVLNRLLHPMGESASLEADELLLASYFADADRYVHALLDQLPASEAELFVPDSEVVDCHDLRTLGRLVFLHDHIDPCRARRIRFEAQRKLYLTKLLIQIEHTRMVQDGPRHRRFLLELLDKELWAYVTDVRDEVASYSLDPHADVGRDHGDTDKEKWTFHVRRVQRQGLGEDFDLEIYHFDTRFKKETAGYDYAPGRGRYKVAERTRYQGMQRNHSASILSKMLRKGINNPNAITDMLGAKFIVATEADVERLAELLHHVLGGIFLFRNQVDLFRYPEDRTRLNRFSAPDFRTFKEDVDILYAPEEGGSGRAYLFSVELQIFTVESFLQTVHSQAYTSHHEYKRRQFLQGVAPFVFPVSIYGAAPSGAEDEAA